MSSVQTSAEGIAFDCDVPPDHFSSVSQDISVPMGIKGSVQLVQVRSGNNLPVAGGRLVSSDGKKSIGFQLVATSNDGKKFDIVFNVKKDSDLKRTTVGHITTEEAIAFSLSLDDANRAILSIGGSTLMPTLFL